MEQPKIITIIYRQEETDPDYGTCLWARFNFDVQNYTLAIESDCGNFMYGWVRTPKTESFLHLMARCEGDYILGKIASRSRIDEQATFNSVLETLADAGYEEDSLPDYVWSKIRAACSCSDHGQEVIDGIYDALEYTEAEQPNDEYGFWECITMGYPSGAKKIAEIFDQHIRPAVRSMEA